MAEGALRYFRAVALDYDGTLAEGQVAPDTLAALAEARARGIRVILVTGRIMHELRAVFAGGRRPPRRGRRRERRGADHPGRRRRLAARSIAR